MFKPIIIVSITEKKHSKILEEAKAMKQANVAIVEWRADFAEVAKITKFAQIASELKKILQDTPLLFTYRSIKEGGQGQFSAEDVYALLHYIISQKQIEMIDIEFNLPQEICNLLIDYAKQNQIVTILSLHDFTKTPKLKVLEKQFEEMSKFNTTIIKIATMANSGEDVLNLMLATKNFTNQSNQKVITMAMGKLGAISRLAGSITNSSYTFASFHKASAPGQLSYQRTKEFLDLFSI
ncbi:MAG: type I 3-dehydroquinate dehydratase [Lactobacillales bacterium]|jgi:3-dehydroquinate dehydratase-1|nr:type I 3-dehydroquinate dehydratase [Lactobacillales bacterium]